MSYNPNYPDPYVGREHTNAYNPNTTMSYYPYQNNPDPYGGRANANDYNPNTRHYNDPYYNGPNYDDPNYNDPNYNQRDAHGGVRQDDNEPQTGQVTKEVVSSPRPGAQESKDGSTRRYFKWTFFVIFTFLFLSISIILSLALWVRPPNIIVGDVNIPSDGNAIQLQSDGLTINLSVNIFVNNPNYFSVFFPRIKADIFYPINNTAIGSGTKNNTNFKSHSQLNFTFPFAIDYKESLDPNNQILLDLATKCGFIGTGKQDITVDYKLTLSLRVLKYITISPVISNNFHFGCPLQESDIQKFINGSGIGIPGM